jgi:hypothetical protein
MSSLESANAEKYLLPLSEPITLVICILIELLKIIQHSSNPIAFLIDSAPSFFRSPDRDFPSRVAF